MSITESQKNIDYLSSNIFYKIGNETLEAESLFNLKGRHGHHQCKNIGNGVGNKTCFLVIKLNNSIAETPFTVLITINEFRDNFRYYMFIFSKNINRALERLFVLL